MQSVRYLVFYDKNTPIKLNSLWQNSPIWSLSMFHYGNFYSELYTETLSISYVSGLYIRLVVTIVATTHGNGTCDMLTLAKLSVDYLVVGITKELNKEPPLHCSFIYINTMWSILQQYSPALMSMYRPHVLLLIYHKTTMPYTCALTSYS